MKPSTKMRSAAPSRPRIPAGPGAGLINLGHALAEAAAAAEEAWKVVAHDDSDAAYDAAEALHERAAAVVRQIESLRASSPAGLQVKLRALIWCRNGEPVEEVRFDLAPTTDMSLLAGLAADLAAMAGA